MKSSIKITNFSCPLCDSGENDLFHTDNCRDYLRCADCALVFVPPPYWLTAEEEKAEYDRHQNSPGDEGYRRFLSRLSEPLVSRLPAAQQGLDFGCGPGPALPLLLEAAGHRLALYDPYYHADPTALEGRYDFICATEVVEHLRFPGQEFARLFACLRPGGRLGLMTKLVRDQQAFRRWHYIRDPTHIGFFSQKTFEFLVERFGAELELLRQDVIILRK